MQHDAVLLKDDGGIHCLQVDQKKLHEYFNGAIAIVGAIEELNAIAVARETSECENINLFCKDHDSCFDNPVSGDVLLVGSDCNGQACDIDAQCVRSFFAAHKQAVEQAV